MGEPRRRLRMFELTVEAALSIALEDTQLTIIDGAPRGASIVDTGYDQMNRCFYLTLQHESFDRVAEGERIPRQCVEFDHKDLR